MRPHLCSSGELIETHDSKRTCGPSSPKLADADYPILLQGESGTGKEVTAQSIHKAGKRASRPFVVIDCPSLVPSLAESELFGHVSGAYTGAVDSTRLEHYLPRTRVLGQSLDVGADEAPPDDLTPLQDPVAG